MKTAEEISIECAKESDHSYTKIEDFNAHDWVIKAMKLYANQKLDEAAEKAELEILTAYSESRTHTRVHFKSETKSMPGIVSTWRIDKQSIISLKDKV